MLTVDAPGVLANDTDQLLVLAVGLFACGAVAAALGRRRLRTRS